MKVLIGRVKLHKAFDERDKLHCTSKSDQLLVYSQNNSHSKVLTCPSTLINLAIAYKFFFYILYGSFEIWMDQIGSTPHEGGKELLSIVLAT